MKGATASISSYRWLFLLVVLPGALVLLYRARVVLVPFVLALVLTYLLNPVVDYAQTRGFSRTWSILMVYAMLGLILAGVVTLVIPTVVNELDRLGEALPEVTRFLERVTEGWERRYARVPLPDTLRRVLDDTFRRLEEILIAAVRRSVETVVGVFSGLFVIVLSPVLAFYILRDLPDLRARLINAIPARSRDDVLSLLGEMDRVLGGFVRGQIIVATLVGTLVALGMTILGVRFALVLGVVAGAAEIIPYFGPVIGALPAVLLALVQSPILALKVAAMFVLIQQLENAVISPRIVGASVGLHPLTVIFALLVGGHLFGFLGLLLAVPVAAALRVLVVFCYRRLGESS